MRSDSKRIAWVDCAKGITILLVIMGHVIGWNWWGAVLRGVIFSFHMPLFFVLSSYTFRSSTDEGDFLRRSRKSAVHLLRPVLIVTALIALINLRVEHDLLINPHFWRDTLYQLVIAGATGVKFGSLRIPAIGSLWFFYVLFFGRSIYDYLQLNLSPSKCAIMVWVISLIGVLLGIAGASVPFSLDIALAVMPFFWLGNRMKDFRLDRFDQKPWLKLLCFAALWLANLWMQYPDHLVDTYLELALKRYPFFPLCFLCAAAGILFLCEFSYLLTRIPCLSVPFTWIGRNSLYLLCIHQLDIYWEHRWYSENQFVCSGKRILFDLTVLVLFVLAKTALSYLNRFFRKPPECSTS